FSRTPHLSENHDSSLRKSPI
ncbi:hypothetical protein CP061683_2432B, partial [Chlamydia psittaci 06-1683]